MHNCYSVFVLFTFFQHVALSLGLILGIILPPSPVHLVSQQTHQSPVAQPAPATTTPTTTPIVKPKKVTPPKQTTLTPGTPEYQQSLQQALNTLAAIATSSPAGSLNDSVRNATVNIICTTAASGPFNSISASGVIVDPRGVIMTNAHVAQYFLLKDYPSPNFVQCIIRAGSPARNAYTAIPLFIPPDWIADNAAKLTETEPLGSGEHDWSLLLVTGPAGPSTPYPSSFNYVPITNSDANQGDNVLIAGYPAGFLGGITIAKDLYAASANATVSTLYTYATSTPDLFSIGGTIVAQHGSSGGPVTRINPSSPTGISLLGIIVTATDAPDTANRDLRALASSYIVRDFVAEAGLTLQQFLNSNLTSQAIFFAQQVAPQLTNQLTSVLNK